MIYRTVLPQVFRWQITVSQFVAEQAASVLIRSRPGTQRGSSFAITTDAPVGKVRVWLSEASYEYLKEQHWFERIATTKIEGRDKHDFVRREPEETSRGDNSCAVCGFDRHHPWHQ